MSTKRLWITLGLVLLGAFFVLGWFGLMQAAARIPAPSQPLNSQTERRWKMKAKKRTRVSWFGALLLIGVTGGAADAWAHCDTLNGPVVKDARQALDKGDLTPLLKWVRKEREPEIKEAFKKTLAVRSKGAEAKALADMYFFETLVRVHRAGEGAPYTGLKSTPPEPVVAKADQSLDKGSVDGLAKAVAGHVEQGIRARFQRALETKKTVGTSVEAGRKFVEAYVLYTHYVEGIHGIAASQDAQHGEGQNASAEAHGQHQH